MRDFYTIFAIGSKITGNFLEIVLTRICFHATHEASRGSYNIIISMNKDGCSLVSNRF